MVCLVRSEAHWALPLTIDGSGANDPSMVAGEKGYHIVLSKMVGNVVLSEKVAT